MCSSLKIAKEWLEATVLKVHPTQGAVLESFELGPRDDGTAERRRINMTWNDVGKKAGLPASVFCKATQSVINRINMYDLMPCSRSKLNQYK